VDGMKLYSIHFAVPFTVLTISMLLMGPKGIMAARNVTCVTSSAMPPTYRDLLDCSTGGCEEEDDDGGGGGGVDAMVSVGEGKETRKEGNKGRNVASSERERK
jgi:hypothetical protein